MRGLFICLNLYMPCPSLRQSICCLVTKSCPTLCNPMNCSAPGLHVLHYLPEFVKVKLMSFQRWLILLLFSHQSHPTLLRPHGLQPARLLCPWDFPSKNTGVGCHFFLQCKSKPQGDTNSSSLESVQFSSSVVSKSLLPHGLHHARPPCPSPTPEPTQTHVH